jgi:hypothetical protein
LWKLYAYAPPSHQPADGTANGVCSQAKYLPEASKFQLDLDRYKAKHTFQVSTAGPQCTKGSFIKKHKSESLEYTDARVTAEKRTYINSMLPRYRLDQVCNCHADIERASHHQQEYIGGTLRVRPIA